MIAKIHIYKAKDGLRWRMKRKGRIVAESGEAYTRRRGLLNAVRGISACFRARDVRVFGTNNMEIEL